MIEVSNVKYYVSYSFQELDESVISEKYIFAPGIIPLIPQRDEIIIVEKDRFYKVLLINHDLSKQGANSKHVISVLTRRCIDADIIALMQ